MGIEDITLRDVSDNGQAFRDANGQVHFDENYIDKIMRLRVVKDNGQVNLGGDKLFIDIMEVYEDFDSMTMLKVGSAQPYHEVDESGSCTEVEPSTDQKCIGSMEFNLDEMIAALQLLKAHAY